MSQTAPSPSNAPNHLAVRYPAGQGRVITLYVAAEHATHTLRTQHGCSCGLVLLCVDCGRYLGEDEMREEVTG